MALETWDIDITHSSINFWVRHMVISKVHGRFTTWNGNLEFDDQDFSTASVKVNIEAASIETHEPTRDAHLRSADFLEVEAYPALTFTSRRTEATGANTLRIIGDLVVHGTSREVVLEAEYTGRGADPWGGERIGVEARTSVDRTDFGLKWNAALEAGGVLVGNKVEITLEIEAIKRVA